MKDIVLPIIAFIVGLMSLYYDPKHKRRKWIYIFFLILTVITTVIINLSESQLKSQTIAESKRNEENLTQILLNITKNTDQIPNMVTLLMKYGYTLANAEKATTDRIRNVIDANRVLNESISEKSLKSASKIHIEYFPKDVDGKILTKALEKVGFNVVLKKPLNDFKTNSIWAGDSVSVSEIKTVALVLFRAGVDLYFIERAKSWTGSKLKLIQIGAYSSLTGKSPFKLEDIEKLDI
jgi:hypothetical protein